MEPRGAGKVQVEIIIVDGQKKSETNVRQRCILPLFRVGVMWKKTWDK